MKKVVVIFIISSVLFFLFACNNVGENNSYNEPEFLEQRLTQTESYKEVDNEKDKSDLAEKFDTENTINSTMIDEVGQIEESNQTEENEEEIQYEEDLNYDADLPEDFDMAYHGDDYVEPIGAFCRNLFELNYLEEPMLFRNDLDAYLIYYLPYIDHEYDTYVIQGTEYHMSGYEEFDVRVEGIMEDGSDLKIRCVKEHEHFNFFSELTPDGTEISESIFIEEDPNAALTDHTIVIKDKE